MPCERCRSHSEALTWNGERWESVELSTFNRDHVHYPPPPVSFPLQWQAPPEAPASVPMLENTQNASSASSQADQINDLQQALMRTSADVDALEAKYEEVLRLLRERDALCRTLSRRVEALESLTPENIDAMAAVSRRTNEVESRMANAEHAVLGASVQSATKTEERAKEEDSDDAALMNAEWNEALAVDLPPSIGCFEE